MRSALGNVYALPVGESATRLRSVRAQTPAPKPAAKFAADPQRRSMIAKIKLAQKQLDFDDGDYRALLNRVTGKSSCTAMTIKELGEVIEAFVALGWAPSISSRKPRPADHPGAKKARALWISLSLLGAIRQRSEAALEAFARRQMGCERFQWADQGQVYKLIEALKAMAERHGWEQSTTGLSNPIWTLKYRLCEALLRRLIAAGVEGPKATMATVVAARLKVDGRVQQLSERDLEQLAAVLGHDLAVQAAADHYED